jgi:flavin reductase (DIM6/NTAB) family NADH-FMN oxidoreductase RutF
MIRFLKKLVYNNTRITEYSPVTIPAGIYEKVFLQIGTRSIEVTTRQWITCLEPLTFAVWLDKNEYHPGNEAIRIIIKDPEQTIAKATLKLFDRIEAGTGILYIFRYFKGRIFHTSYLEAKFLFSRYYKKPGLTFTKYKSLVTGYSYPRKVRIISFMEPGHFNIFPMDLLSPMPDGKHFVFGLRHTNKTLSRILAAGRIVVSEIGSAHKTDVYKLGAHHSSAPPSLGSLPFSTSPSKTFGFPVTSWAESYREIEIRKTIDQGSHMLMWGEIVNEVKLNDPRSGFYHIHFLLFLHQARRKRLYELV